MCLMISTKRRGSSARRFSAALPNPLLRTASSPRAPGGPTALSGPRTKRMSRRWAATRLIRGRLQTSRPEIQISLFEFHFSFLQPCIIIAGFIHVGADAEIRARPVEIERHDDVPRNAERLHQFRDQVLGLRLAFA